MEKLELKHLAPYLPYSIGIEITTYNGKHISYSWGLKCCSDYLISEYNDGIKKGLTLTQVKPILRPLSDLINNEFEKELGYFTPDFRFNLDSTEYQFIERMLKLHFDVFGLIEKGLAIDINKLAKIK